jgi:hypothetical protein
VPSNFTERVRDQTSWFDEQEVAFYRTARLRLVAVWRLSRSGWSREVICNRVAA